MVQDRDVGDVELLQGPPVEAELLKPRPCDAGSLLHTERPPQLGEGCPDLDGPRVEVLPVPRPRLRHPPDEHPHRESLGLVRRGVVELGIQGFKVDEVLTPLEQDRSNGTDPLVHLVESREDLVLENLGEGRHDDGTPRRRRVGDCGHQVREGLPRPSGRLDQQLLSVGHRVRDTARHLYLLGPRVPSIRHQGAALAQWRDRLGQVKGACGRPWQGRVRRRDNPFQGFALARRKEARPGMASGVEDPSLEAPHGLLAGQLVEQGIQDGHREPRVVEGTVPRRALQPEVRGEAVETPIQRWARPVGVRSARHAHPREDQVRQVQAVEEVTGWRGKVGPGNAGHEERKVVGGSVVSHQWEGAHEVQESPEGGCEIHSGRQLRGGDPRQLLHLARDRPRRSNQEVKLIHDPAPLDETGTDLNDLVLLDPGPIRVRLKVEHDEPPHLVPRGPRGRNPAWLLVCFGEVVDVFRSRGSNEPTIPQDVGAPAASEGGLQPLQSPSCEVRIDGSQPAQQRLGRLGLITQQAGQDRLNAVVVSHRASQTLGRDLRAAPSDPVPPSAVKTQLPSGKSFTHLGQPKP